MYDVYVLGASMYDVRKIFGFCVPTPYPPLSEFNYMYCLSANLRYFLTPPPLLCEDVIYGSPLCDLYYNLAFHRMLGGY